MNAPGLRFIISLGFADEPWATCMRVNWKHLSILAIETMACYEVLKCIIHSQVLLSTSYVTSTSLDFGDTSVYKKGPRPQPYLSEYTVTLVKLALSA